MERPERPTSKVPQLDPQQEGEEIASHIIKNFNPRDYDEVVKRIKLVLSEKTHECIDILQERSKETQKEIEVLQTKLAYLCQK